MYENGLYFVVRKECMPLIAGLFMVSKGLTPKDTKSCVRGEIKINLFG